ncbi:MAG: flagellar motor protein MotA [Pseudomonadota bacterium]
MANDLDPYKLSSPRAYLVRMVIFLAIVVLVLLPLYGQIVVAFQSNPLLNGLILFTALVGILLAIRQVIRLFPEVAWVNGLRIGEPGLEVRRPPVLLAPMASLIGDRIGETAISTQTMRSLLESIGTRLDEARDILRYLTGLLVFLGLLGTFWGLLQTVSSVGQTIQSLDVGSGDANVIFEDLKAGLEAPLTGMGTAFSSSLFGLAGSLVLGFLDLQAGQAQSRFYVDLEDWLSTVTDLSPDELEAGTVDHLGSSEDLREAINRLARSVQEGRGGETNGRAATHAMANLAEGIQGLVQHVRSEQKMMREWAEAQTKQQARMNTLLERLSGAVENDRSAGHGNRPHP